MARLKIPPAEPPYAYRSGTGFLYRLPAALKFLLLLALSLSAFFFGFPALLAIAGILCAAALSAGVRPWSLLRGGRPLFITALMVLAFRSLAFSPGSFIPGGFSPGGFTEGLGFALTVLESFAAGALLFRVTTMTELRESLGRGEALVLRPLIRLLGNLRGRHPEQRRLEQQRLAQRWLAQPRLSLGIALMLGFLSRFFEIWETLTAAYDARGGPGGTRRLLTLLPLAAERMIESAAETACALESRGIPG
ncbi:MAG: energy-coupling factor transporter transmembrane protein EcfT [Spirochaetaceae bacterium]|jgi:biotin transport system permease protein|nr:energy-coupling factor transporter transmembrane protein EcfT [Spirochaetaceae bacterium]